MTARTLLVDPLAAFFRPALEGCATLILNTTYVEVTLLPPLAKVAIVRGFTNSSDEHIEAILTLPPIAQHEVIYRLIVNIGGIECHAKPQPGQHARRAHDDAIVDGRRAILYELLKNDVQLISIAGIEPGAQVEVQIWSIKPLGRLKEDRATLSIPLSAQHDAVMSALSDADALVTAPVRHIAKLSVDPHSMQVFLQNQGSTFEIMSPEPVIIDCAAPILLDIAPRSGGSLDHCVHQVDQVGGWEVTSARGVEGFRHPSNPGGSLVSNRNEWIFGVTTTADDKIRVTAPLPIEGMAPNALALCAFAAAGLVEAATPQEFDAVRRTANILSRRASLAFIGPSGELPQKIPMLRKLALPEMLGPENRATPPPPVAEPPSTDPEPLRQETLLPIYVGKLIAPGSKPPSDSGMFGKLISAAVVLVGIVVAFRSIDFPLPPRLIAIAALLLLAAIPFLPRRGSTAWHRLPLLIILPIPWIISLLAGPLMDDFTYGGAPAPGWMIPLQYALLAASALLPVSLMPLMREARRFTAVLGALNFALTLFVASSSVLILTPGS